MELGAMCFYLSNPLLMGTLRALWEKVDACIFRNAGTFPRYDMTKRHVTYLRLGTVFILGKTCDVLKSSLESDSFRGKDYSEDWKRRRRYFDLLVVVDGC